MVSSKTCTAAADAHGDHAPVTTLSLGDQWLSAMVANLIVTVAAMIGALMVPFLRNRSSSVGNIVMTFSVALAVGSLLGDAILHLLPTAFGAHAHAHGGASEPAQKDDAQYLWMGCVTLIGVYGFFVVEKILHYIMAKKSERMIAKNGGQPVTEGGGIKPVAWLILLGDGLHNFVDGLAIGVAFMGSWEGGLQTSFAVLMVRWNVKGEVFFFFSWRRGIEKTQWLVFFFFLRPQGLVFS